MSRWIKYTTWIGASPDANLPYQAALKEAEYLAKRYECKVECRDEPDSEPVAIYDYFREDKLENIARKQRALVLEMVDKVYNRC